MTPNATLAGAVLGRLAGLGVKDYCVCAGARNMPLVSSLLAKCQDLDLRIWHHFDERTAAFFALGLAKKANEPVAVFTTSGTAAAEVLPAVIEAHYSGIPLILVTADRPLRFRGTGAPQVIEQAGLFGPYADAVDVAEVATLDRISDWGEGSPLHLNVSFEEPRAEDRQEEWTVISRGARTGSPAEIEADAVARSGLASFWEDRSDLLVLLGEVAPSWRREVERFLVLLGVPVWADAASGLRESNALAGLLRFGEPEMPGKVLRIGGIPSLRLWRDLEEKETIPVLSICRRPFPGLARRSQLVVTPTFPDFPVLPQEGPVGDRTLSGDALDATVFARFSRSEPSLLHGLSRRIPQESLVYLGNSLPIREWNTCAVIDPPHPHCFASRGANGIDGQVATFLGLSEGQGESWGIFGDLTALCDLNAPALIVQLSPGKRRIVVIHNGGGRIFSRLPCLSGMSEAEKQITENRHHWRFHAWAAMWGIEYRLWRAGEAFPDNLPDTVLIEAIPDEGETEAFWRYKK